MTKEIITFGCRLNAYESEVIKQAISAVDEDIIVFNTCSVTKEAERQARQAIRKKRKESPNAKIVVTGCAAQIQPEQFAKMAEVDKILGNEEKFQADFYNAANEEKIIVNDIMSVEETASHLVASFEGKARAFVQVQNGCDHRCTFCIIPYGRGNSRSVAIGDIVKQMQMLVDAGYNEVVLTGVDVTAYGADLPGRPSLGQMLKRVLALVPDLKRVRLSSIDVAEIDDELWQLLCNEERVMPHVHISLQAGDNMILKRMKRRHTREDVIDFCTRLREARPDVAFGADIITGFPTETEEMFQQSLDLVDEAGLQYLHIFPYSEREGTPAAKMPAMDMSIRKERAKRLREKGEESLRQFLKKQVNKTVLAIVEKEKMARTENFSFVELNSEQEQGSLLKVVINGVSENHLIGEVIS